MTDKHALPVAETPAAIELRQAAAQLPYAAPDGTFFQNIGRKYLKDAGIAVFHMIGGVERMAEWANKNEGDYYTKIYPKLLEKQVEITDMRTVEDVIDDLDAEKLEQAIDAEFERV